MTDNKRSDPVSGGVNLKGGLNVGGDIVGRDKTTHVHLPSTPVVSSLHQLPAAVADFVGRKQQIAFLLDALRAGRLGGIQGLGGIGKSELARAVAQSLVVDYPDAQFWVDLRGMDPNPRPVNEILTNCIRAFVGLDARLPDSTADLKRTYRSCLSGKHVLIVLDNAADAAQVNQLLPPDGCAVLITSRESLALPGLKRIVLEELLLPEAHQMLIGIAPRVGKDTADNICRLCGCLPLAVRAAGSLLDVTPDLDAADYADELLEERTRLLKIGAVGVSVSVDACFNLSYRRLTEHAKNVLCRLAVFPSSFDANAEDAICQDPGHACLSGLLGRSLVLYDLAARRYRLHDLMRMFADARLKPDARASGQRRHSEYYLAVLATADELYRKGRDGVNQGLTLFDFEWENIQAGQACAATQGIQNEWAMSLCTNYPFKGTYCLSLRQNPRERIRWLESALGAARHLGRRLNECAHLVDLGVAYRILGEARRAIEYQEQALTIAREIGDRSDEGAALGNLGLVYADLGEPRRTIEYEEQHLAIAREIGDRRGEGNALGNLGLAYFDLREMERSIEYNEQQLAIAREIGDRRGEGSALGALGSAYWVLRKNDRAIECFKRALDVVREIGERRKEAETLKSLGAAYWSARKRPQAVECFEQALTMARSVEDPRIEEGALLNLANAYLHTGDPHRAIELYELSLAIARRLGNRLGEADALWNLSLAFAAVSDTAEAMASAGRAFEIYHQIGDPNAAKVQRQLAAWRIRWSLKRSWQAIAKKLKLIR